MSTLRTTHWNRERTQNIIIITLLGIPGKQILEAMLIAARERIWQVEFAPKHSCLFVPPPPPRPPSVPLPHQQQSDPQFFIWTESPFVLHAEGMEEDFSGAWVALGEQMTLTGPTDVLCRGSRMFSTTFACERVSVMCGLRAVALLLCASGWFSGWEEISSVRSLSSNYNRWMMEPVLRLVFKSVCLHPLMPFLHASICSFI